MLLSQPYHCLNIYIMRNDYMNGVCARILENFSSASLHMLNFPLPHLFLLLFPSYTIQNIPFGAFTLVFLSKKETQNFSFLIKFMHIENGEFMPTEYVMRRKALLTIEILLILLAQLPSLLINFAYYACEMESLKVISERLN